jgi:hypothetical protein
MNFGAINYVALNQDRFADSTATNYQQVGLSETFNVDNFGGGFFDQAGIFFIPVRGGTASTFVTDRYRGTNGTGWRVLGVGGTSVDGSLCGPWFFASNGGPGAANALSGSLFVSLILLDFSSSSLQVVSIKSGLASAQCQRQFQ